MKKMPHLFILAVGFMVLNFICPYWCPHAMALVTAVAPCHDQEQKATGDADGSTHCCDSHEQMAAVQKMVAAGETDQPFSGTIVFLAFAISIDHFDGVLSGSDPPRHEGPDQPIYLLKTSFLL